MKYKIVKDGYIMAIGTGNVGDEISETEYKAILSVLKTCPNFPGKGYRLKTDLTWESYDLPEPEEPEVTAEEILADLERIL